MVARRKNRPKPLTAPEPGAHSGSAPASFKTVFRAELGTINERRRELNRRYKSFHFKYFDDRTRTDEKRKCIDALGLAFSGGGIRSAAVCLGVLQALDAALREPSDDPAAQPIPTLLERVDYLSTVSGGGYIGSSLIAGLTKREGQFPFCSLFDRDETLSIKHIRDHSNYLFANGFVDVLDSVAIYLRGLLANFVIVLSPILLLAAFTIYCNRNDTALGEPIFYRVIWSNIFPFGIIPSNFDFELFAFTKLIFFTSLIVFLVWGLVTVSDRICKYVPVFSWLRSAYRRVKARVRRIWQWGRHRIRSWRRGRRSRRTLLQAIAGELSARDLERRNCSETGSNLARFGGVMLAVLVICAFFETQPWILKWLFARAAEQKVKHEAVTGISFYVQTLTVVFAGLASIVGTFADKLEKLMNKLSIGGRLAKTGHYSIKILIYAASVAVPFALWGFYLLLCYWGIESKLFCGQAAAENCTRMFAAPDWLFNFANRTFNDPIPLMAGLGSAFLAVLPYWMIATCDFLLHNVLIGWFFDLLGLVYGAIQWLLLAIGGFFVKHASLIAGAYASVAAFLIILSLLPALNGNSLHRLYRDRLSTAFVFYERSPRRTTPRPGQFFSRILTWKKSREERPESARANEKERPAARLAAAKASWSWLRRLFAIYDDERRKRRNSASDHNIVSLDQLKLTQVSAQFAPYQIINTALNIQGSKYANQRGRNADFFMFSRNYVGSEATDYVETSRIELIESGLNLATAMAVSGAAASANMGSKTIKSLTPTLAILNIRLGYWLRNPIAAFGFKRVVANFAEIANMYFLREMFWRLNENSYNVYLTDGGHIENLGLYELLKRRCRLIIAVDSEADPNMLFGSFIKLQRHARIDLGTRIELPWQAIRNCALGTSKMNADGGKSLPDPARAGPHAALGVIRYPNDEIGYLLYIKSSLSGDENDYIIDYQRRNPTFPHETTGDQLFSEEQFEVYRALGFHMTHRVFTGEDRVSALADDTEVPCMLNWNSRQRRHNPLPAVRRILGRTSAQ